MRDCGLWDCGRERECVRFGQLDSHLGLISVMRCRVGLVGWAGQPMLNELVVA